MAFSPKLLSLFFLLTTLIFSPHTHARDSQFFSKFNRNRDPTTTTTTTTATTTNNPLKENEFSTLTKLEDHQQEEKEEEPIFIPQTTGTGYGLYGHETGLDPPSTATTTTAAAATTTALHKNYAAELKGLSEFNNNDNNYYYNRNQKTNSDEGMTYQYTDAGYNGGVEKQGISDTRFLENGKYYYDLNNEKKNYGHGNYIPYTNNYNNGNYKNNYKNNNGHYGNYGENNYEEYYNNNNGNSMQGYQTQIPEEEEFDFHP